ncbi:uncharacterized protein LOC133908675 isoform X2 [Phragmites australis]|uniref:uncharacterized protein LOC133908675 isoform X2 n=1 Tax=Phragmites australis TaxID=29695 RepID=UPI002D782C2A|nr:uncharacterized protein LOC133908675 isoform X2 [Phragmites australis]
MVWFFEHFQAAGNCFDYALHEHPLIKNWGGNKVVKRAHLEGIKKFGAEKVVIRLELNDSEARTDSDHLEEEIGEGSSEGMNNDYFKNVDFTDNGEKEGKNLDGSNDDEKGDGCLREDTLESIKGGLSALEQDTHHKYISIDGRIQVIEDRTRCLLELHAIVQRIVKLLDGSNRPTTCEKIGRRNREKNKDTRERGNSRVNNEKPGKPCREPAIDHKRTYSSGTSNCDQSNIFRKRKIDLVSSPTLVEKVKTRRDMQPSKVCKSPYEGIKRNMIFGTKTDGDHVDEVTEGLALSNLELAAIKFVQKELAQSADKVLVRIGISDLRCSLLRCLIRPVRENGTDKWLDSEIITSYARIFNSIWEKEPKKLKHAVSAYHSDWLRCIGKDWIKTGLFCKKVVDLLVHSARVLLDQIW